MTDRLVLSPVSAADLDALRLLHADPQVNLRTGPRTPSGVEAWAWTFFPELPVVAFTEVHHHASVAVMQRLGLRESGVVHRPGRVACRPGLQPDAPYALYRRSAG